MKKNCLHCGQIFLAKRRSAKFCSGRCRSSAGTRRAAMPSVIRSKASIDALLNVLPAPVDPDTVDPRAIFAEIASDPTASPSARIQAAKALQATQKAPSAGFDVNARAAQILAAGRRLN